ncbi:MAG: hypothetical protein HYX48_02185 [Chlamydiales bacterium]|nr:hypothetical protein [Chlamydiales bacterium]
MQAELHQNIQHHIQKQSHQEALRIPYDTRPMEGSLRPGEKIALHGGIIISNQSSEEILIREDFLLYKGGYHLTIIDPATGSVLISALQSPMNTAYFFHIANGLPVLEKHENISKTLIAE